MTTLRPNQEARVGRMLDALLASDNEKGKVLLTVAVKDAGGGSRLHETFQLRKWSARFGGARRLFVSIPRTADWEAEPRVKPVTPLTLDLETGELREDRRDPRVTPLVLFAARAAWRYALTGEAPRPGNGSVEVREEGVCGACGLPLTDDTSLRLGIGPDCEKRLYGKATSRSRTMTSKAPKGPAGPLAQMAARIEGTAA